MTLRPTLGQPRLHQHSWAYTVRPGFRLVELDLSGLPRLRCMVLDVPPRTAVPDHFRHALTISSRRCRAARRSRDSARRRSGLACYGARPLGTMALASTGSGHSLQPRVETPEGGPHAHRARTRVESPHRRIDAVHQSGSAIVFGARSGSGNRPCSRRRGATRSAAASPFSRPRVWSRSRTCRSRRCISFCSRSLASSTDYRLLSATAFSPPSA